MKSFEQLGQAAHNAHYQRIHGDDAATACQAERCWQALSLRQKEAWADAVKAVVSAYQAIH